LSPRFALGAFIAWLVITVMWWALAFAPLPVPPDWLASARSVCFGTQPNGLPEPWGWATLIASPLAMLGFLLGVWGRDLGRAFGQLAMGPMGRVALMGLAVVPLVGVALVGGRVAQAGRLEARTQLSTIPEELPESYPRQTKPAPSLDLVDQGGEVRSVGDFEGRPVLVTFAFAHCKTICPVVVETVKRAATELTEVEPAVVIVTLDPWRDTPSALPSLVDSWQLGELPVVHVLSGEVPDVLSVLEAWNMPIDRDPQSGDVSHPALVYVLAPDGTIGYTFSGPTVAWVVEAVRRVMA
jgi:cytochrome oxidase Cu insertion factor (SCO1/SenC/PrrC family)